MKSLRCKEEICYADEIHFVDEIKSVLFSRRKADFITAVISSPQGISPVRRTDLMKKLRLQSNRSFYGAGDEARTRYLHLGKVALYRMSYTRNGHVVL